MEQRLTTSSFFLNWQTLALFVGYFVFRALSFVLAPHPIVQGVLVFILVIAFAGLYFKDLILAWQALLAEIFLGGAGHFLELGGLSLRTVLIGTFLLLWVLHHASNSKLSSHLHMDKRVGVPLLIFACYLLFALFNGFHSGHEVIPMIRDLTPFAFFLLIFPFHQLFHNPEAQSFFVRLFIVYLLATALFLTVLYFLYSYGVLEIHEPFYNWFRDINAGKITDMGNGFFRIVEPSHLLIVPIILFISSLLLKNEKHNIMWRVLIFAALVILSINLSRIYILALGVGWFVLLYKHSIQRWIGLGIITLLMFLGIFTGLSLTSAGNTLGWELFGVRLASVAYPSIETSSLTRMTLLPPIIEKIEKAPIQGHGLGATVTFIDPRTNAEVTTHQFDWGYLEIIAELGSLGLILFLVIFFETIAMLIRHVQQLDNFHDFHVGLLAGVIALLVINITSPALFHVFGILFLVFLMIVGIQHHSTVDDIITALYRVFNRKKG